MNRDHERPIDFSPLDPTRDQERFEPMVRDGHAVRVPRQVLQDLPGTAEGTLGIDDPVAFVERLQLSLERFALRHLREPTVKREPSGAIGPFDPVQYQSPSSLRSQ